MSRATKRVIGNVSVLTVLVAIVAVLAFSAMSPTFLKNDAKLTAEANAGTPIVQAMNTPAPKADVSLTPAESDPKVSYSGATPELAAWAESKHADWVDFYLRKDETGFVGSSYSIFIPTSDGGYMWARNLAWEAPKLGEIVITVNGDNWTEQDLHSVSNYVMTALGPEDNSITTVTVTSENGSITASSNRAEI